MSYSHSFKHCQHDLPSSLHCACCHARSMRWECGDNPLDVPSPCSSSEISSSRTQGSSPRLTHIVHPFGRRLVPVIYIYATVCMAQEGPDSQRGWSVIFVQEGRKMIPTYRGMAIRLTTRRCYEWLIKHLVGLASRAETPIEES